jgi:hypothetical protein
VAPRGPRLAVGASLGGETGERGEDRWLTPILVDHLGRDGSTLLMRLLATSPQVAVEGPYPFERKYFAYMWRWSTMLDRRDWPRDRWGPGNLASLAQDVEQPLIGPPPWLPRSLAEDRSDPLSRRCFELAWGEFSRRAATRTAAAHGCAPAEVRYYAEKHLGTWNADPEPLAEARLIVLLRDPRDVYVSRVAFSERRGEPGFARPGPGTDEQLREYVVRQGSRLRWIASLSEGPGLRLVAYEDLVRDLSGVADRLEDWLGAALDAAAARSDKRLRDLHVTAQDPDRSIGRWKEELPADVAEMFSRELGPQLEALGFER